MSHERLIIGLLSELRPFKNKPTYATAALLVLSALFTYKCTYLAEIHGKLDDETATSQVFSNAPKVQLRQRT